MSDISIKKGDLLLEFFSEEIPARMQSDAESQIESLFKKSLDNKGISYNSILTYSGPRHLALIIKQLDLKQKDQIINKKGPKIGSSEKAIQGFLKSNNINFSNLTHEKTKNGEFYFYSQNVKGLKTSEILPEIINEVIYSFVWSKSQRWSYSDLKWARPLRNILLLLNDKVINGQIKVGNNEFLKFTNYTFGHRDNQKKIIVNNISDYEALLRLNNVILDRNTRKNKILSDIELLLKHEGLKLKQDDALLNEVLGLIELPNVMIGSINKDFMDLPPEVLSTAMKVHQKYFSIIDNKNNLQPKFIFVSNTPPDKIRDSTIIEGNQRVLKARLADASFFWKTDTSNTFKNWNNKLKKVLFYEDLGSVFDKTIRMSEISKTFSVFFNVKATSAREAALFSKSDLVSEMVGEFPELQGIMGGYYSKLSGMSEDISTAIFEHYKPKGLSDKLPETKLGSMLSIIDKIDTLTGFFVINKKPSGSKDPFALRRTGFSIAQILINFKLNMTIEDLFISSLKTFKNSSNSIKIDLINFITDKIKFVLKKQGFSDGIVESVFNLPNINNLKFQTIYKRIEVLSNIGSSSNFKLFLTNFKRLNNILKTNKSPICSNAKINVKLFEKSEEQDIYNAAKTLELKTKQYLTTFDQEIYLKDIIKLHFPIYNFFENVVVNHDDKKIRDNRLLLLMRLRELITKYSKFNLIDG